MNPNNLNKLSTRQRACLRLVAELKKTEQIADELGISPSTVNTHIERAIAVLGANSRREAALAVVADDRATGQKYPTEISRLSPLTEPPAAIAASTLDARRQRNDLTKTQRLALAMICLALLCIAIAGVGAALQQLSDWRASLAH